jgi:hypothetical protein
MFTDHDFGARTQTWRLSLVVTSHYYSSPETMVFLFMDQRSRVIEWDFIVRQECRSGLDQNN